MKIIMDWIRKCMISIYWTPLYNRIYSGVVLALHEASNPTQEAIVLGTRYYGAYRAYLACDSLELILLIINSGVISFSGL